ncbi:DUF7282 domain-containing protein [Vibrio diabolicus]|uniref:DUF7282 domain-containing protein n=1 Tax=Vibrio diabolicus TaxID=50719 RepID=A0ABM6SE58_9VIBR|nr:hypothetical protein [Vibrio diabolicus]AVH28426.1 hypothetical protein AL468_15345 [Vibrio diabolicus]|eukprot:NODE_2105_length_1510_cov_191.900505_g2004_i0.p2 GENE.NODE_2105_length_1510_cov_191.900505_g2004_i0~~NODE_2105_length_1510_cov_191.900505_g2004_i0.p2  ORF type:complete len:141 (-),score=8.96 NODE_2105_length_1510_cov_191.900505_g2004_i0:785-1207(-)
MNNSINNSLLKLGLAAILFSFSSFSFSAPSIKGVDQDMTGGTVTAKMVHADDNGWMVVHRTDESMKPGPVIGYAPLKMGQNENVNAILMEPVESGDMLMLMVHGEKGGMKTGVFEYTLGAKEDGPVKVDGKLVMDVVRAK